MRVPSRSFLFCVFLCLAAVSVRAEPIADSGSDFSGTQGQGNWYYGFYDGDSGSPFVGPDFEQLPRYEERTGWILPGYWTAVMGDSSAHTNAMITSSGRKRAEHWAVRRWISPVGGNVMLSGQLAKIQTIAGDGVTGHIVVDGKTIWSHHLLHDDRVGVEYAVPTTVRKGTVIDFVVAPGRTDWADGTQFTARISTVETPSTSPSSPGDEAVPVGNDPSDTYPHIRVGNRASRSPLQRPRPGRRFRAFGARRGR